MYAAAAGAAAQAAYGVPTSYMQALAAQQTSLTRQTSLSCTVASPSPTSSTEVSAYCHIQYHTLQTHWHKIRFCFPWKMKLVFKRL